MNPITMIFTIGGLIFLFVALKGSYSTDVEEISTNKVEFEKIKTLKITNVLLVSIILILIGIALK